MGEAAETLAALQQEHISSIAKISFSSFLKENPMHTMTSYTQKNSVKCLKEDLEPDFDTN